MNIKPVQFIIKALLFADCQGKNLSEIHMIVETNPELVSM
jgi:hypothetical protein